MVRTFVLPTCGIFLSIGVVAAKIVVVAVDVIVVIVVAVVTVVNAVVHVVVAAVIVVVVDIADVDCPICKRDRKQRQTNPKKIPSTGDGCMLIETDIDRNIPATA